MTPVIRSPRFASLPFVCFSLPSSFSLSLSRRLESYCKEYVIPSTLTSGIRFVDRFLHTFSEGSQRFKNFSKPSSTRFKLPFRSNRPLSFSLLTDSPLRNLSEQRFRDFCEVNSTDLLSLKLLDPACNCPMYNIHFSIDFFGQEKVKRRR